jgi:hypothetical protein
MSIRAGSAKARDLLWVTILNFSARYFALIKYITGPVPSQFYLLALTKYVP